MILIKNSYMETVNKNFKDKIFAEIRFLRLKLSSQTVKTG